MSIRDEGGIILPNMLLNTKVLMVVALICSAGQMQANNFSTTNLETLGRFFAAAESTNKPVTVVSFGDSMADSYRSPTFHLMNKLTAKIGVAGYSFNNYKNTALWVITNGAYEVTTGPLWFSQYFGLPANSSIWWNNQLNAGGVACDIAGLFYVAQPLGGQFNLSISTNGGPWVTHLTLDGYSPSPVGRYTNVTLQPNNYRIRLDSLTGTNYALGRHQVLSHTGGVNVTFVDYFGIHLGQVTNVPLAIRQPIFAALDPDLIIWHMKEDGSLMTSNRMEECENWWKTSATNSDVIYIGTPWISLDISSSITPDQNTIARNIALRHGRAYADLMQPTVSYQWLVSSNFMLDVTHLNSVGGLYCANIMWDDLGFFTIGLNKKLSLSSTGTQLNLSYNTSAGAVYRLEVSTNLQTWTAVVTNPVGNALFSTNFIPPSTPAYYRLGLRPQ